MWMNDFASPWSGVSMVIWVFLWLVLLAGIGALVVWLLTRHGSRSETPVDILKRRYARGEITKETFERMKRDLES